MVYGGTSYAQMAGYGAMAYGGAGYAGLRSLSAKSQQRRGSSYGRTLVRSKGRKTKSVSGFVKNVIYRMAEKKQYSQSVAIGSLLHGNIYTKSITTNVVQGTSEATRVGDAVQLSDLRLKGVFATAATAGAYQFRVMVVASGEEYNVDGTTSGLVLSELFNQGITAGTQVNAIVNPKACTVLHDEVVNINSTISGVSDGALIDLNIPLNNQVFKYQSSGSVYGKFKNIYVVLIGWVLSGTSGTTPTGSITFNYVLNYRDV